MITTLDKALWNRTDIATLRAQFEIPDNSTPFLYPKDGESVETYFPWLVDVLCWINGNDPDKNNVFVRICSHGVFLGNKSACLVDFFLGWCAPVNQNILDQCLACHILFGFTSIVKRLLDAGAHPKLDSRPLIPQSSYNCWLMIHDHRLDTRAIARAVLHVARRRETRHGIPRDVWRMVAEMVWSKRFEVK